MLAFSSAPQEKEVGYNPGDPRQTMIQESIEGRDYILTHFSSSSRSFCSVITRLGQLRKNKPSPLPPTNAAR